MADEIEETDDVRWITEEDIVPNHRFLSLRSQKRYRLKILTRPLEFCQRFQPVLCRVDPERDPFEGHDFRPVRRFACFAIDRDRDDTLVLVDLQAMVYGHLCEWRKKTKTFPHAPGAPDFVIAAYGGYNIEVMPVMRWSPIEYRVTTEAMNRMENRLLEARRTHTRDEIREMFRKVGGDPDSI